MQFCVITKVPDPLVDSGKILILNSSHREYGFPGRKPSKWSVEVKYFNAPEEAITRARELLDADI